MSAKLGRGANIDQSARKNVYKRDNYRCRHCGKKCRVDAKPGTFYAITIDHVVPYSISRSNLQSNLVTSCYPCNNERGDDVEWVYRPPANGLTHKITMPKHLLEAQ